MSAINLPGAGSGQAIGNATIPPEGPKCLPLILDFTAMSGAQVYTLDVGQVYSKGPGFPGFSVIQGLYIDNSNSTQALTVIVSGTQQNIKAPAGSQGYYPILSPTFGQLTFKSLGNCVCQVELYNVPLPAGTWDSTSASSGGSYDAQGNLKTKDQGLASIYGANAFLPTQDVVLEAAKSAVGQLTAINVNVVEGGGGGPSVPPNLLFSSTFTNQGGSQVFGNGGSGKNTTILYALTIDLLSDTYYTGGAMFDFIMSANGQYMMHDKYYVPANPTLAPGVTNVRNLTFPEGLYMPGGSGSIYCNLDKAVTGGTGFSISGYGTQY